MISGGAQATLGALAGYAGGVAYTDTVQATGTGSLISLPNLATLTDDPTSYYSLIQVQTLAGASVQSPSLTKISGGPVHLESDGAASQVNVSDLTTFSGIRSQGTRPDSIGSLAVWNSTVPTDPLRTASVAQVRQPVYQRSVARWKNYDPELAELFRALAQKPSDRSSSD